MVPERAAALISCTPSFPPESEVPFLTLADRIFWQGIKDEVDPLRPFRPGRQRLEVVELIFGSANVRTLLPAERSAASRAPHAMTGRRVDLADQLHQAGISIVGIQETRCRRQVAGSCRGFGVFAAAADKAAVLSRGHGKTSWDIPGHDTCWSQSFVFFWSIATPRLVLSSSVCAMDARPS